MAYTYKKLSDVEFVESAVEPNILIEDEGEIKKISASNIAAPQVRADWDEEDETSAAYILNKPDFSQSGGGANVVTYTLSYTTESGTRIPRLAHGGDTGYASVSPQEIYDAWDDGAILRLQSSGQAGSIVGIYYTFNSSGAVTRAVISYFLGSELTPTNLTIN